MKMYSFYLLSFFYVTNCYSKNKQGSILTTESDNEALMVLNGAMKNLLPAYEKQFSIKIENYSKFFSCLFIFTKLVEENIDEILDSLLKTSENEDCRYQIKNWLEFEAGVIHSFLIMEHPDSISTFINDYHFDGSTEVCEQILIYVLLDSKRRCLYDGRFNELVERMLNNYNLMRDSFEQIVNTENDLNVVKAMIDKIIFLVENKNFYY